MVQGQDKPLRLWARGCPSEEVVFEREWSREDQENYECEGPEARACLLPSETLRGPGWAVGAEVRGGVVTSL